MDFISHGERQFKWDNAVARWALLDGDFVVCFALRTLEIRCLCHIGKFRYYLIFSIQFSKNPCLCPGGLMDQSDFPDYSSHTTLTFEATFAMAVIISHRTGFEFLLDLKPANTFSSQAQQHF